MVFKKNIYIHIKLKVIEHLYISDSILQKWVMDLLKIYIYIYIST